MVSPTVTLKDVLDPGNLHRAVRRVIRNRGAPGVDRLTVGEFQKTWPHRGPTTVESILNGNFEPSPVRSVEIPKAKGGTRRLGIPTVMDRVVQQAMAQRLVERTEPVFSPFSFAYRPCRSVHDAIQCARQHILAGNSTVVAMDVRDCFGSLEHQVILKALNPWMDDSLLRLTQAFLTAGMVVEGEEVESIRGTPQGGPLSPVIANLVLDRVDRHLTEKGINFIRYADDVALFCQNDSQAIKSFEDTRDFLFDQLKLTVKVTEPKDRIMRYTEVDLLGFGFSDQVTPILSPCRIPLIKDRISKKMSGLLNYRLHDKATEISHTVTGWSSFYRIASIPVSTLLDLDRHLLTVLREQLSESMRKRNGIVTMEGVESNRAVEILRRLGFQSFTPQPSG